jgi:hypothetical protein
MARHKLQPRMIAALLSAGATEEIISVAQQILATCHTTTIGRPRKYKDKAARDRAYRERKKKARDESRPVVSSSPTVPRDPWPIEHLRGRLDHAA